MQRIIRLFIMLQVPFIAFGQKQNKPFSELYITPHMGVSWQSTVANLSDNAGRSGAPYDFDKNTKGFGLDAGFTLSTSVNRRLQIGIKTNGRFRYDYIYGGEGFDVYPKATRQFLFDYANSFLFIYSFRKHPDRNWIGEIGFTTNQLGKKDETFYEPPYEVSLRYQYTSYFFGLGYDLIKLGEKIYVNTGFTINYIPGNYPVDRDRHLVNFGLKALVRFQWRKIVLSGHTSPSEKS